MIIYACLCVLYISISPINSNYHYILYYIVQDGYTPLHYASNAGHLEVALLLLNSEADPNAKNYVST